MFTYSKEQLHPNYPEPTLMEEEKTNRKGEKYTFSWYETHTGRKAIRATTAAAGGRNEFDPTNWNKSCGGEELRLINNEILLKSGTLMHMELEYYLKNRELPKWVWWPVRKCAESIIPTLNEHVRNIRGVEQKLSNTEGTIAGTSDLIADYMGTPSIIDYKTAYKFKSESELKKYFLQATLYARMLEQMTGIHVEQIVLLMVIVNDVVRIDYVRKVADYNDQLDEMLAKAGVVC